MFIQTEVTPNPDALKFLPGTTISPSGPVYFSSLQEAQKRSSLAVKLFNIDGVFGVFFGNDFITVSKDPKQEWIILKPEILMTIMDHIVAGFAIFDQEKTAAPSSLNNSPDNNELLSEIEKQIIEIIETRVRPSVAMDGGDIVYVGFEDGIVKLEMRGACHGCPSSIITLKNGIKSMLQHYIPEVKDVEAVNN